MEDNKIKEENQLEYNLRYAVLQETIRCYGNFKDKTHKDIISISEDFYKFVTKVE